MKGEGFRKGMNEGHGRGLHSGSGSGGFCTCSRCGFSVVHQKGIPCFSLSCPNCKTALTRTEIQGKLHNPVSQPVKPEVKTKPKPNIQFPKVIPEKCTGCGVCISKCPTQAIVLKDGKAFVETNRCRNCRICIQVCAFGALIVE